MKTDFIDSQMIKVVSDYFRNHIKFVISIRDHIPICPVEIEEGYLNVLITNCFIRVERKKTSLNLILILWLFVVLVTFKMFIFM